MGTGGQCVLVGCVLVIDDKQVKYQNFLPSGKKELCAAKGSTGSLAALKGRPCICVALRTHMSY